MTHEEIERTQRRLQEIVAMERDGTSRDREIAMVKALQDLSLEVGAWRPNNSGNGSAAKRELAQNIHQALQTASMIDACTIAAQNAQLTRKALRTTWIAAIAAVLSALAAWVAITR